MWEWMKQKPGLVVLCGLGGVLLLVGGSWWLKMDRGVEVEIIKEEGEATTGIWVDVAGAVEKPGTYQLASDARLKDALAAAGGLGAEADRNWVARYVNLAQKVVDGAKIYIPSEGGGVIAGVSEVGGQTGGKININTASVGELDQLSGIGEVRAKAIVEGRPYGEIEELVKKGILPKSSFEKIQEEISVF